jgi:hypothetical protein
MRRPGPTDLVHRMFHVTTEVARETRALHRAIKAMPKPMPWDWAAPRLLPILSGPSFDPPGEPLVRVRSEIGPMVEFGVDLGKVFTFVDVAVARRWECSPDQLLQRSLQNLDDRAARIDQRHVSVGVMSGRSIRILRDRPRWASSLVLAPEHLFRLFGDHDQVIGAPSVSCLVSLPMDTPTRIVADIVVDLEIRALRPLWLDPFFIEDRRVVWSADEGDDDFDT